MRRRGLKCLHKPSVPTYVVLLVEGEHEDYELAAGRPWRRFVASITHGVILYFGHV